ncbi:MAG: type II toxin-antitoxin system HicB family antitoxin [Faecalicoccus sp.]|uniref:type II toxin-antitoxin system HicB family antitoxin n=1 Tax=unclassified Faecalicoccus TaxID=2643311 RepID=UPI0025D351F4|nr:type II toxin-antitoxin system HicB family antitoxin [Faecalicoccus sp.]MCI6380874.1 type II toxin-antitoxin system HicB family antitoxin [Erysipelotrichaceae bacterium]MDY4870670.1 type II toxin-antitoxin system HicB family antitoxin [Faecalicoccus sp.]
MKGLTYLAVLEPSGEKSYSLYFPDMPGCYSDGKNLEDALKKAKDALELHYYGMVKDGEKVPKSTGKVSKEDAEGCIVCPVTIYPDVVVEKYNNKKVKTNCTLPAWLKEIAENNHINYSQVLEAAIKQKLGLNQ